MRELELKMGDGRQERRGGHRQIQESERKREIGKQQIRNMDRNSAK